MGILSGRILSVVSAAGHHAPAKSELAEALGWLRVHLLNAVAITAVATIAAVVAAVVVPFVMEARARRRPEQVEPSARDRAKVLRRIRNWITKRPELAGVVFLNLAFRPRPDLAASQDQALLQSGEAKIVDSGKAISQIFEDTGASLLIVGPPGSGKTTMLLRLGLELLDRASEQGSDEPIPIVADLTSWAMQPQPLSAWLAKEVAGRHKISADAFGYWLARNELVLLLDGLDEVKPGQRDACVQAISDFRSEHGLTGIAVCCGETEAEKLPVRLELDAAMQLELPTDSEIDNHLRRMEAAGTPTSDIRAAIEADDDLRDLLRAPLMLRVVTRACQDLPAASLQLPGSPEGRLHRLWDEYVASMFERRPAKESAHVRAQEIRWLEWLACELRERSQTEFRLSRLTTDWLPPRARKFMNLYIILAAALGGSIEFSIPDGVYWSWTKLKSRIYSGPFVGLLTMYLIILAGAVYWITMASRSSPNIMYLGALLSLGGLLLVNFGWETEKEDLWTAPHEGIWHAAINGLVAGLTTGVALGVALGVGDAWSLHGKVVSPLTLGIIAALIGFLVMGLQGGFGFCVAYCFIRALLAYSGRAPWRYKQFLDAMTTRQLMRSSGGSYLFTHRLLRDHLADKAGNHNSQTLSITTS